jgi:hypothetical protein
MSIYHSHIDKFRWTGRGRKKAYAKATETLNAEKAKSAPPALPTTHDWFGPLYISPIIKTL